MKGKEYEHSFVSLQGFNDALLLKVIEYEEVNMKNESTQKPDSSSLSHQEVERNNHYDKLLEDLIGMLDQRVQITKQQWNRSLPFADYIVDRWEKASSLGFGKGSSIYDSALVQGDVKVGINTWIGPFVVLDGSGELQIGDYCSISSGVQIYTHDTVAWALSGGKKQPVRAPVKIGSRCYIGPNSIISKGIQIGDGCVIGANSFVDKDVPEGMRVWGTPARIQKAKDM